MSTRRAIIAILLLAGINTVAGNGFGLLIPQPHEVVSSEGQCAIPAGLGFSDEFKDERLSLLIARMSPGSKSSQVGFLNIKKVPMSKGDEAYELKITPSGVEVSAVAPVGAFYALKTLEQLARGGALLPCGTIRDWPDLKFRGVHLMTGWLYVPTTAMLRQMVEEMADLKYNKLVLEYDEQFPWKHGAGDAYTVDELRNLIQLGQDNFIEIIPLIDSLGHMEPYLGPKENAHLREQPDNGSEMCPQNPESLTFIKNLWSQVLAVHPDSSYAHITGDEAFRVKPCPKCQPYAATGRQGELYCQYYADLSRWTLQQGKTPLMWGDMFIKHPEALEGFPRDVVICDWDYSSGEPGSLLAPPMERLGRWDEQRRQVFAPYWQPNRGGGFDAYPYLKFFGDQGFKTIACSSACAGERSPHRISSLHVLNNQNFALRAKEQSASCLGLLNTLWTISPMPGYWFGVVAGGDYSWNCRREPFADFTRRFAAGFLRRSDWTEPLLQLAAVGDDNGHGVPSFPGDAGPGATPMAIETARLLDFATEYNAFVQARRSCAERTFRSAAAGTPSVLDLGKAANHTLKDALPIRARGLTTVPGNQEFSGLPFKLNGQQVISLSSLKPETVKLPLNRKLSGLVFWDTGYNVFPERIIARMTANYVDHSTTTFDFVGGENILDWTAVEREPKSKNSCVAAWRGSRDISGGIISWLTSWRNPKPDVDLASIELTALPGEKESHFVVLGITALEGGTPGTAPAATADSLEKLNAQAKALFSLWVKPSYAEKSADYLFSPFKQ